MMPPRTTAAQTCRCVRLTGPVPRERRDPQREDDARRSTGTPSARRTADRCAGGCRAGTARRARRRAPRTRRSGPAAHPGRSHWSWLRPVSGAKREQPNTLVARASSARRAVEQRDERRPAGVVAGVAARAGDAAAEDQPAAGVVEERLAGGHHAEPLRLRAVVVAHDGDVGQRRGGAPRVGLLPAVGEARAVSGRGRRSSGRVRARASTSASSPRLARVQTHCGWTSMTSVGRSVWCASPLSAGHCTSACALTPG